MKTPSKIDLYYASDEPTYNPEKNTFSQPITEELTLNCLANFMSQKRVFEEYGSRSEKVLIVRFNQPVAPFSYAYFKGDRYEPIETVDTPIKHSIHLKYVGEDNYDG